jgi:Fur family ferric uptake transcriptional regulator
MTRQRQTILEELQKTHSHLPADEIYERVRRQLPHISLGTIYRNLDILSEHGLVRKLEYAGFQRRYDGRIENHYHVRCARCGSVEDIEAEPLPEVEEGIGKKTDYTIIGHRLEFIGICPVCKEKKPDILELRKEKEK